MPVDDLQTHARSDAHDYYALIEVAPEGTGADIRRAYRRAALKYHPDKHGDSPEVVDKFHLLSIAYEVLSDPAARSTYDTVRRARVEREERDLKMSAARRKMKEDLERREGKRTREEVEEEERRQAETRRLAADGARRRMELTEQWRKEEQKEEEERQAKLRRKTDSYTLKQDPEGGADVTVVGPLEDEERAVVVKWQREGTGEDMDMAGLEAQFSMYGKIDCVVILKDKKRKLDDADAAGAKRRKIKVATGMVVFKSMAAAFDAVHDKGQKVIAAGFQGLESVDWVNAQEPAYIKYQKAVFFSPTELPSAPTTYPSENDQLRIRALLADDKRRELGFLRAKEPQDQKLAESPQKENPVLRAVQGETPKFKSFRKPETPRKAALPTSAVGTPVSLSASKAEQVEKERWREQERQKLREELMAQDAAEDAALEASKATKA